MGNLFDDEFRHTDMANSIDRETNQACRKIMDTWVELGYSPREIYYVMSQAINDLSLDKLLKIK